MDFSQNKWQAWGGGLDFIQQNFACQLNLACRIEFAFSLSPTSSNFSFAYWSDTHNIMTSFITVVENCKNQVLNLHINNILMKMMKGFYLYCFRILISTIMFSLSMFPNSLSEILFSRAKMSWSKQENVRNSFWSRSPCKGLLCSSFTGKI